MSQYATEAHSFTAVQEFRCNLLGMMFLLESSNIVRGWPRMAQKISLHQSYLSHPIYKRALVYLDKLAQPMITRNC